MWGAETALGRFRSMMREGATSSIGRAANPGILAHSITLPHNGLCHFTAPGQTKDDQVARLHRVKQVELPTCVNNNVCVEPFGEERERERQREQGRGRKWQRKALQGLDLTTDGSKKCDAMRKCWEVAVTEKEGTNHYEFDRYALQLTVERTAQLPFLSIESGVSRRNSF